jgi:hypothetical protein
LPCHPQPGHQGNGQFLMLHELLPNKNKTIGTRIPILQTGVTKVPHKFKFSESGMMVPRCCLVAFLCFLSYPLFAQESPRKLPLPAELFKVNNRSAFLIKPKEPAANKAWVWYAPTLPAYPAGEEKWMFEKFTAAGIAIAGIDVGESYGSPEGRKLYSALYQELTEKHGLSKKPILLGRSRGGLMLLSWGYIPCVTLPAIPVSAGRQGLTR